MKQYVGLGLALLAGTVIGAQKVAGTSMLRLSHPFISSVKSMSRTPRLTERSSPQRLRPR